MIENVKLQRLVYLSILIVTLLIVAVVGFSNKEPGFIISAVGIAYVPALFGMGWLYVWREFDDPVKFLGYWCSVAQFVNLITNLIRIRPLAWGVTGVVLTFASMTLIVIYIKRYFRSWKGNLVTVILIIFTTVATFWFILDNFNDLNPWMIFSSSEGYPWMKNGSTSEGHPWMIDESTWLSLLGGVLTYMGVLNAFTSLVPQVFLLDLWGKTQEYELTEALFESLDSEHANNQNAASM